MSYTADELKGAGHLLKNQMLGGGTYTFILYRPKNQTGQSPYLSGSGYFTFETVRDSDGFYPTSTSPLASGTKTSISGSNTLIESPGQTSVRLLPTNVLSLWFELLYGWYIVDPPKPLTKESESLEDNITSDCLPYLSTSITPTW